ncbi:unnamed protein product [Trypanosoma congolense IL3000]|uniref:WGS project CAEQ00000000 data, annotated contig 897 n=1 Tax=Trypanosoma congolense (strain IL3000) TaxID=1068625 RepID=F9WJC9_TRYCI|nr:unnamed protein product [Trypanosoma congolense IL3000]
MMPKQSRGDVMEGSYENQKLKRPKRGGSSGETAEDDGELRDVHALQGEDHLRNYVHDWMDQMDGVPRALPTSLPPIATLPMILDIMLPRIACPGGGPTSAAAMLPPSVGTPTGTGIAYDEVMALHTSDNAKDFERPNRLKRTLEHLKAVGLLNCCSRLQHRPARTKELRLVHCIEHIDRIDQLEMVAMLRKPGESYGVGEDIFASEGTSKAARMAVGCVIAAAISVVRGEVRNAFALVRPPGHHAGVNSAAGFCFFNNVAVAVRVAQKELKMQRTAGNQLSSLADPHEDPATGNAPANASSAGEPRVLVLDWDVHHGDGTESIFYDDPSVVVISIHQYGEKRGHVVRKTPTVIPEAVALDELEALMEPATGEILNLNGPEGIAVEGANSSEAARKDVEWPRSSARPNGGEEKSLNTGEEGPGQGTLLNGKQGDLQQQSPDEKEEPPAKRQRKPVDYNKLAAEMVEGDEDIARMFGVTRKELEQPSTSSSGSTETESTASSQAKSKFVKYPGDTDGFSFEEDEGATKDKDPFYPGSGHMDRVGGDTNTEARGKNINIPWPTTGMGDLEYLKVVLDIVLPVIREFEPEIVFVSCGFDSAAGDLIGSMQVTPSGYYVLLRALAAVCPKLVVALEGGYNLSNVARCTEAVVRGLLECSHPSMKLPKSAMLWCQAEEVVQQVRQTHGNYWKCFNNSFQ